MHGRVARDKTRRDRQRVGVKTARCTGGPSEFHQTQVAGCGTPARSHVASMSADFPILDSIVLVVIVEGAMREPIARHLLEQACYDVAITLEWAMTGTGRAAEAARSILFPCVYCFCCPLPRPSVPCGSCFR